MKRSLGVLLALFAVAAPLQAQVDTATIRLTRLASLYGITVCHEGRGVVFVQQGLSAMDEAATKVHEQKHVEQYTRFPSCKEFNAFYRTPVGLLAIEAEAYAAGDCQEIKMGGDPISLLQISADKLEHVMGGGTPRLTIIQELQKWKCQG